MEYVELDGKWEVSESEKWGGLGKKQRSREREIEGWT